MTGSIVAATLGLMEKQTFILNDPSQDKYAGAHMLANFTGLSFLILGVLVSLLLYQRHTTVRNQPESLMEMDRLEMEGDVTKVS